MKKSVIALGLLLAVSAQAEEATTPAALLSALPPPTDMISAAENATSAPLATPAERAPALENDAPPAASEQPVTAAPDVAAPEVPVTSSPVMPAAEASAAPVDFPPVNVPAPENAPAAAAFSTSQPVSSKVTVAQMGQTQGITLSGGQLQSGIVFTLPGDQVVTNARLDLTLKISPALAARNTSLQLMMNGQPLGTLPLSASDRDTADYQLDIPSAMVVSTNNLSFKVNDAEQLVCERDGADNYQLTIMPNSALSMEGLQLNLGSALNLFPRPFIDPLRMSDSTVPMVFSAAPTPGEVSAASIVSSWMGMQSDYRGVHFPVTRDLLPEGSAIVFGRPGETVGGVTLPQSTQPLLKMIDHPGNPVWKLLLVVGNNDDQLRQAAWRLTSQPMPDAGDSLSVSPQSMAIRQPYDAPRWIDTHRPVLLQELLRKDQRLVSTGVAHDALSVNFRAAPDLFLWDGETFPLKLHYRFPTESWLDEDRSYLSVSMNNTFLRNLTVNKQGILENIWHRLGGDARQEQVTMQLDPYLIYGDNQLKLYFNIKPKENAPCSVLSNDNIKSQIEQDAAIDLSNTRHFTQLPNLSYFVGASFPFSRQADYAQTVMLLPEKPTDTEISTLLSLAARSGSATGVALNHNTVTFGVPQGGALRGRLQDSDVLAVSTLGQVAFNQAMLADTPYTLNDSHALSVKAPDTLGKARAWLNGDWGRQPLEADRYLSSNQEWRGFLSYRSPWNDARVVVMTIATDDRQLSQLGSDLAKANINAGVRGDTSIITDENGIRSFRVGAQFPSGEMPWYMMLIWYASQHTVLLALLALTMSTLIGLGCWSLMRRHAWRRLNPQQDKTSASGKKK